MGFCTTHYHHNPCNIFLFPMVTKTSTSTFPALIFLYIMLTGVATFTLLTSVFIFQVHTNAIYTTRYTKRLVHSMWTELSLPLLLYCTTIHLPNFNVAILLRHCGSMKEFPFKIPLIDFFFKFEALFFFF